MIRGEDVNAAVQPARRVSAQTHMEEIKAASLWSALVGSVYLDVHRGLTDL